MWRWPTANGLPPTAAVGLVVGVSGVLVLTASAVEFEPSRVPDMWRPFLSFVGHLIVMPDWSYLPRLGVKMLETVEIAALATAIATLLSFPLGILAAANASPHPVIFHVTRQALTFMRALPELVWALLFVSAVGLGPLPGVMALAFVTVGFMGKFFAESIEVVGEKSVDGIRAVGAGRFQLIQFAMLPQAMPDFIGTLLYILDHNVRAAAILGLVGAGGIGYDMVMTMRLFQYDRIVPIAFAIYLVVTALDRLSDVLRSRAIGKPASWG